MTLAAGNLATELANNIIAQQSESAAAKAWAKAYTNYARGASANGLPMLTEFLDPAQAEMEKGLKGMSAAGAGAVALQVGVQKFWASLAANAASKVFAGSTLITPPPCLAIATQLTASLAGSNNRTQADGMAIIAGVLHTQTIVGGTVTFPGLTAKIE